MADRTVKVTLRADTTAFTSGMRQAAQSTKDVADSADKAAQKAAEGGAAAEKGAAGHKVAGEAAKESAKGQKEAGDAAKGAGDSTQEAGEKAKDSASGFSALAEQARTSGAEMQTIGATLTVAGAALTAFAAAAISTAAEFDAAMSSVAAATHAPAEEMAALRDAAIEAGAKTAFSAKEAAQGIEELAKAGVSTSDILGGGLDGALSLAAAGAIDVGEAAETAASAMTQFKLSGSDVTHVADLLAAGAGKAQGGVSDLGAALNQSGLIASQAGLTIEETVGALAAFASAGLVGSDAGTSFKTMLQKLQNPSKAAKAAMDELGVSLYDAQGNFVGTEVLAGQLKSGLADLTQEQKNAALATIFGSDAIRAAAVFAEQGAEGIAKWNSAVNDQGYAAETAALMMDNLKGDLEELGGSWETLLIKMGDSGQGPLRSLVQNLTEVVNWFSALDPSVQGALLGVTAFGGAALTATGGLLLLLPKIVEIRDAMDTLGINAANAKGKISDFFTSTSKGARAARAFTAALAIAAVAQYGQQVYDVGKSVEKATAVMKDSESTWRDMFHNADTSGIKSLDEDLQRLSDPSLWQSIETGFVSFAEGFAGAFGFVDDGGWNKFKDGLADIDAALAGLDPSEAAAGFQKLAQGTDGSAESLKNLLTALPQYRDSLIQAAEAAGLATDDATLLKIAMGEISTETSSAAQGGELFRESLTGIATSAASSAEALQQVVEAMSDYYGMVLELRGSNRDLEEAIDAAAEAIEKNGSNLDISTEAGRENEAALDGIAAAAWKVVDAQRESGASADEMAATVQKARDALISQLEAMGLTSEEAAAYADTLGLIPEDITTSIQAQTQAAFDSLTEFTASVDASTGTVTINGNSYNGTATLGELLGNIDESDGTVTINGNKVPADTTLYDYLGIVNNSDGTVSINGDSGPGKTQLNGLKVSIDKTTGTVTINGRDEASKVAKAAVKKMPASHTITVTIRQVFQTIGRALTSGGSGRKPNSHATGGAIFGPGTATSDSIPAWLSDGEHVMTAAEVNAIGGQDAAYRLRSLIRAGALRPALEAQGVHLATGGAPVSPAIAPPSISLHKAPQDKPVANVTIQLDNPITGEQIRHLAEGVADGRIVRWRRSV